MPPRSTPIRRKLIRIILLTCGAVMILMCVSFFSYAYMTLRRATVRQLSMLATIVAANSTATLAFGNQNDAEEILSALKAEPYISSAALYDKNGKLFSKYPLNLPDSALPATPQTDGFQFGNGYLSGFQPVVQADKRLGTLYIKLDAGAEMQERLRVSITIGVASIIVCLLVAYLLSQRLQRQISQPILALAKTATSISDRRDFSVRAEKFDNDELGLLTDAFNHMLAEIHKLNLTLEQRVEERTAQLQYANQELQAFSYSVSHDLRAPLRHVLGFVDLLREHAGPSLSEKSLRYMKTIDEAAKRMGNLIDHLLAFSRLGRAELQKADVSLHQLVEDTLKDFQMETKQRDVVWDIQALPTVWVDRALLRMVLVNLISNALKFTSARAQARIEIGCLLDNETETVIFIRDNGAGFNPRYADKLFGVFQRLHSQDEFEGTGIGLANIQRIIHRHGGRVWAEGIEDGGATFYFSIPKPSRA